MAGGLVTVASGMAPHIDEVAIRIANRLGALHPARLGQGREVVLPEVRFPHLFVPRSR